MPPWIGVLKNTLALCYITIMSRLIQPITDRPIEEYLSPKEVAGHFGLSPFSAYRWIGEGIVPENYVRRCGKSRLRLHPSVIPLLEEKFAGAHDNA